MSTHGDTFTVGIARDLRQFSTAEQARCEYRRMPRKHKYAMVSGEDRRETKQLLRRFAELNPKLVGLPYPKREDSLMSGDLPRAEFVL